MSVSKITGINTQSVVAYVIWKHPGHFTSMKNEFGSGTTFFNLCVRALTSAGRLRRSIARACEVSLGQVEV